MGESAFRVIQYSELERWDVKYFAGRIKSQYPLVSLADFVTEHNEKIRPFESPDETFKILGVNNFDGIFHAYDALGKEIKQPYKKVSAGDFAYNPYRINVGSIGWVLPEHDGAYISPAYVVFSVDSSVILPEVFWFILKSDFFNQTLRAATAGSVRMNLTYSLLKTLKIPIPPLPIQKKIVAHWEAGQLDQSQLLKKEQGLIKESQSTTLAFLGIKKIKGKPVGKMFCLPWKDSERWSYEYNKRVLAGLSSVVTGTYPAIPLNGICTGVSGSTPSKKRSEYWADGTLPWVSPKDMKTRLITDSIDHISDNAVKERQAPIVASGSILFVVRSGILQHTVPVAMTDISVSINQDIRAFTPNTENVLAEYLLAYFEAKQDELLRLVKWSTTVQSINKEELESFPIPLPPVSKQKEIISTVRRYHDEIDSLRQNRNARILGAEREIEKMILGTLPVEVH